MYGIVTIVEHEAGRRVVAFREAIEAAFGRQAVNGSQVPHTTYQAADGYDLDAVRALLERTAAAMRAFEAPSPGIGFVSRVAWLNLTLTPALGALHEALWDGATAAGSGVVTRYGRETWFPHVTLGEHEPAVEIASALAPVIARGGLPETVMIDNLSVIEETAGGHEVVMRVPLAGA